jgi:hypothetical protein
MAMATTAAAPEAADRRSVLRGRRTVRAALVFSALVGVLFSGLLVYSSSQAAFNGKATNPSNAWSAGRVAISDDDGGSVQFAVTGAKPGDTGTKCIAVTYTGDLTVPVKLYASASSGTLRSYVTLTVEQGTGGTYADCSAITGVSTVWTGNLTTFATTYSSWSTGVTAWTPTGSGQSRTYRISWSLDDDDLAANKSAAVTLTWEVRSS